MWSHCGHSKPELLVSATELTDSKWKPIELGLENHNMSLQIEWPCNLQSEYHKPFRHVDPID